MNTQRQRMKHKKMLCFQHNYKSVCAEGSLCFIYAHPVVVFSPHHAEQCCYQSCYCQLVSSGCLYWSEMWCYWNPVVAPSRYMLNWLRPTGSWKSGGMKCGQRQEKKNAMSRTTRSHALLITHSLWEVFSICVHQAQKKNNMGLPAGWCPG